MTLLFRPPRPARPVPGVRHAADAFSQGRPLPAPRKDIATTMDPDLVIPDDFKREPETLGKVLDDDAENKRACEAAKKTTPPEA